VPRGKKDGMQQTDGDVEIVSNMAGAQGYTVTRTEAKFQLIWWMSQD
jgi:hypothetical protein